MSTKYLNDKISLTSLSAPTAADKRKLAALSNEERQMLLDEALELGHESGISTRTIDEIWESALLKARAVTSATTDAV